MAEKDKGSSEKTNLITIEKYIKGINFPASKDDLLNQAQVNDAPEDVIQAMNQFDEQEYQSPADVAKQAGKIH